MKKRAQFFKIFILGILIAPFFIPKTEAQPAPPPPPPPVPCFSMNREMNNIPDRFAPPTDVTGDGTTVLLDAQYCENENVKFSLGNGNANQYIWNHVYVSRDGRVWDAAPLAVAGDSTDGSWVVGNGSATSSFTDVELRNANFFVAYVCTNNGSVWQCGCSDSACGDGASGKWSLQSFHTPLPLMYCTTEDTPTAERVKEATAADTIFCWVKNLEETNAEECLEQSSGFCDSSANWNTMPDSDWAYDTARQIWRAEFNLSTDRTSGFTEKWRNTDTTEEFTYSFTVN